MQPAPAHPLDAPLTSLRGVGPDRVAQLARLKLRTIGDLLMHPPRRYEDRRHFRPIAEMRLGEAASARGKIIAQGVKRWRRGSKSVFEFILDDGSGHLYCRWWNLPFMEKYFQPGDEILVHGRLASLKPRAMDHPETENLEAGEENFIHLNRVVPVYPLTEGLPQRWLRSLVWRTLQEYGARLPDPWSKHLCGRPPEDGSRAQVAHPALAAGSPGIRARSALAAGTPPEHAGDDACATRAHAVRMLHFPEEMRDAEIARQRLALEEFLELQL